MARSSDGEGRIPVSKHHRKKAVRRPFHERAPKPGQNEFSPDEEMQMRQGQRQANAMPPAEPDADDMGMM